MGCSHRTEFVVVNNRYRTRRPECLVWSTLENFIHNEDNIHSARGAAARYSQSIGIEKYAVEGSSMGSPDARGSNGRRDQRRGWRFIHKFIGRLRINRSTRSSQKPYRIQHRRFRNTTQCANWGEVLKYMFVQSSTVAAGDTITFGWSSWSRGYRRSCCKHKQTYDNSTLIDRGKIHLHIYMIVILPQLRLWHCMQGRIQACIQGDRTFVMITWHGCQSAQWCQ